jgi:hypothetical protein
MAISALSQMGGRKIFFCCCIRGLSDGRSKLRAGLAFKGSALGFSDAKLLTDLCLLAHQVHNHSFDGISLMYVIKALYKA